MRHRTLQARNRSSILSHLRRSDMHITGTGNRQGLWSGESKDAPVPWRPYELSYEKAAS